MTTLTANWLGAFGRRSGRPARPFLRDASGLDPAAVAAVLTVRARPGQSVSDLAATLGMTHSGCVRVVGRLVDSGLLVRGPGPDGTYPRTELSDDGETMADEMLSARAANVLEGCRRRGSRPNEADSPYGRC